jgi:hypothetical protein
VKRLFLAISLMSVLNMAALCGLFGYAWMQGWMTPDRVRQACAVLVGEGAEAPDVANGEGASEVVGDARATSDLIRGNKQADERYRIELDRRKKEIENGWAQLQLQQLALVQRQEAFDADKKRFATEREQLAEKEGDSGFQAELETLSAIDAKNAKELLKLKSDADVVRILMAMDGRKRSKIVKTCKTDEERLWIGRMMEMFHDSAAAQAEDLGSG